MEFNATFIIAAISFLIFTFIMNLILYKPMAKIVQERDNYIAENEKVAKNSKQKADLLLDDKNQKIKDANSDARHQIVSSSDAAKKEKSTLISKAQELSKNNLEQSRKDLIEEKNRVKSELFDDVISIAQNISSEVLGEDIAITGINRENFEEIIKDA